VPPLAKRVLGKESPKVVYPFHQGDKKKLGVGREGRDVSDEGGGWVPWGNGRLESNAKIRE